MAHKDNPFRENVDRQFHHRNLAYREIQPCAEIGGDCGPSPAMGNMSALDISNLFPSFCGDGTLTRFGLGQTTQKARVSVNSIVFMRTPVGDDCLAVAM